MSFKKYRLLDILFFSMISIIFEIIAISLLNTYEYPFFSISFLLIFCLIVMVRWNKYSFIIALLNGILYAFLNNGSLTNYIIYSVGNLFIMFNLIYFKKYKKIINSDNLVCFIFILNAYFLMCIGRSIIAFIFDNNFFKTFLAFLGTEVLNLVFSLIVIFLIKNKEGIFEDQVNYIRRINLEIKKI